VSATAAPRPVDADARDKRLTLIAAIVGSVVVFVDGTVVNVALPAIRTDLGGGLAGQQWLTDAYLLTLGSLLLIGGSLGDLYGRRRVFRVGLLAFGATSMLCAVAPTVNVLIISRGLQGIAGALLVPNTLGLIVARFAENERGAAIGSWTAWSGIAMVIGPLGGGLILAVASWRWVFAVNVLPIAFAYATALRLSDAHDHPPGGRVDVLGALLGALGLAGPVYALIEQPVHGWGSPQILGPLVAGVVLLCAFVWHEHRTREPMLTLELFRQRNFAVGNAATLGVYGGLSVVPFFLVLFLQQVAGYTPLQAGVTLLPVTVIMFALSRRFGALADRLGPRLFMGVGPLVAGVGIALFARLNAHVDFLGGVVPAVLVFGLGLSLTVAPLTATVLGGVDERHAGMASAINNAVARIAGLLAVAAVGAAVASQFASTLDARAASLPLTSAGRAAVAQARGRALVVRVPPGTGRQAPAVRRALTAASVDAFRLAMELTAALVMIGGLLSAAGIRNPRRAVHCSDCPGGAVVGASRTVRPAAELLPRGPREPAPAG
jgi:EmrB/QacA subfamily drug resistance transporter